MRDNSHVRTSVDDQVPRAEKLVAKIEPKVADWVQLLSGTSPEEVLRRMSDGDPLRVYERCGIFLKTRAFLIDLDRFHEHALAVIAIRANTADGQADLDGWMSECLDAACIRILQADLEAENANEPIDDWEPDYRFMVDMLAVLPGDGRKGCVGFNSLKSEFRRAWFRLVVDEATVDQCIADGFGPRERFRELVLTGFQAIFGLLDEERPWIKQGKKR